MRRERRGVDHTNSDESHVSIFKRILGSHYREEHHELLMYIDQSQLEIERIDIASGSFGSITTAVWHRPASFEHKEATKVNVVLKRLQRKYIANNSARFIHEVRNLCIFDKCLTSKSAPGSLCRLDWTRHKLH